MKLLTLAFLLIYVHISQGAGVGQCTTGGGFPSEKIPEMETNCTTVLKGQIKQEFTASITYMAMSAHFSSEARFRPGLSKFFLESAMEERVHAKKIMAYLLMRGIPIDEAALPPVSPADKVVSWPSALSALEKAYDLEKKVTESIENILKVCENGRTNDYHTVDYFTGDFLTEQHEGLRTIAGYITTLKRMGVGALGEVLFDKTML